MATKGEYLKVIDDKFVVPTAKGGGLIKFEAWELDGEIVKYNMFYINKEIFPSDNGRVLGYDNSHNYHHKHYMGAVSKIDFVSYIDLVTRFREEIKEFVKW